MKDFDISGNISFRKEKTDGTDILLQGYCAHPELATLLYENLLNVSVEDLEKAALYAAQGNEIELLKLLSKDKSADADFK